MKAIARRGLVCCLALSLFGAVLYGQETPGQDPNQRDRENPGAEREEYVQKLMAELKARAMDFEKVQAQLKKAEAEKQSLATELEKLRQALNGVANQKKIVDERAKKHAVELEAQMQEMMARQQKAAAQNRTYPNPANEYNRAVKPENELPLDRQIESVRQELEAAARATAGQAMKRAAEMMGQAARHAQGAASKLEEPKPDVERNNLEEGWKRLMERAEIMLQDTRRNDEIAATYRPKIESAVTQLRKAGRNDEAERLQAEANMLLSGGRRSPDMPQVDARPDNVRRDVRDPRASGDVKQAIDELRGEVEQLRGEVRELRQLLERGKTNEPNPEERTEHRVPAGAVVLSVAANADGRPAVHVADGEKGMTLDPTQQAHEISNAIGRAIREGRNTIILKADANVRHADLAQVVRLASIQGATVHVNVQDARAR